MSDIFISYASEDRKLAQGIAQALATQGWSVWWDRKIPPGKTFDRVIEEELARCRCVVVLWSKTSVNKRWVRREARGGDKRGILIPVLIDKVDPPFEFSDVQAASMTDWNGSDSHAGFKLLIDAVDALIGRQRQVRMARRCKSDIPQPFHGAESKRSKPNPQELQKANGERNWNVIGLGGGIATLSIIILISLTTEFEPMQLALPPETSGQPTFPVRIESYGASVDIYRNNRRVGITPYEFEEELGTIQLECRQGNRIALLTIDVGARRVWTCDP